MKILFLVTSIFIFALLVLTLVRLFTKSHPSHSSNTSSLINRIGMTLAYTIAIKYTLNVLNVELDIILELSPNYFLAPLKHTILYAFITLLYVSIIYIIVGQIFKKFNDGKDTKRLINENNYPQLLIKQCIFVALIFSCEVLQMELLGPFKPEVFTSLFH